MRVRFGILYSRYFTVPYEYSAVYPASIQCVLHAYSSTVYDFNVNYIEWSQYVCTYERSNP